MSNFVYTNAKRAILAGEIDFDTDDLRVLAVMSNTTADTEKDKTTLSGFTTLDEMDGSGYARQALTGGAVAADDANDRGEFTADDVVFANVSAGTRLVAGFVFYKHVSNDTDSIPVFWVDTIVGLTLPLTPNGGNIRLAANAEGLLQAGS